jgi:copper(I)-binding protein
VNRFKTRAAAVSGLAVLSVIAASTLTGCGSGQISQTATQESAVNGSSTNVGQIALRDVRIQAAQTSDAVQPGKTVDLLFVAANQSPDSADRLLSVSSDIGSVTVTGDAAVPPLGSLMAGAPYQRNATALSAVKPALAVAATVALDKPITSGPLYNFTFTFERNGQATLGVPVTAPGNATQP